MRQTKRKHEALISSLMAVAVVVKVATRAPNLNTVHGVQHQSFEILCSASEVKAQLEYLRGFHRRRLPAAQLRIQ
jgi:hypothetical protein